MDLTRWAINQLCSPHSTFEDDLRDYAAAGAHGIGIYEPKLDGRVPDRDRAAAMREAGMRAVMCVPTCGSLLPDGFFREPVEPEARVEALCASIRRFAAFDPVTVMVLPGSWTERGPERDRELAVEGLRTVAACAADAGVTVGLEALRPMSGALVTTLAEAAGLIDAAGVTGVGLVLDTWHVWDTPDVAADIARLADRVVGVQVADWRDPTRGWCDRVLPGDGVADLVGMLGTLDRAGFDGWHELEIFSDDGTYGDAYPDSLYLLGNAELARRGSEAFRRVAATVTEAGLRPS
jgi:sugar phosphate isomerase/epimerase